MSEKDDDFIESRPIKLEPWQQLLLDQMIIDSFHRQFCGTSRQGGKHEARARLLLPEPADPITMAASLDGSFHVVWPKAWCQRCGRIYPDNGTHTLERCRQLRPEITETWDL